MRKKSFAFILTQLLLLFALVCVVFYIGRTSTKGVRVSTEKSVSREQPAETQEKTGMQKVNINVATKDELQKIPGVGEVLAQRILDYRQEHGRFTDPGELIHVSGIGKTKLNDLLAYVTVTKEG